MVDLRDPVSSLSHFFMCFWAIFATLIMRRLTQGDRLRQAAVTVFGGSMITLYFFSGLFHGLQLSPADLRVYQKLDQSAIYLLIAGTYTPVTLLLLTGRWRNCLFTGVWLMAFAGIVCLWALPKPMHAVTVSLYLIMGWFGMLGVTQYSRAVGRRGMSWVFAGALLYTIGAVVELAQWPVLIPGVFRAHELLHVCDMAATYCHFVFIVRFVIVYHAVSSLAFPRPRLAPT